MHAFLYITFIMTHVYSQEAKFYLLGNISVLDISRNNVKSNTKPSVVHTFTVLITCYKILCTNIHCIKYRTTTKHAINWNARILKPFQDGNNKSIPKEFKLTAQLNVPNNNTRGYQTILEFIQATSTENSENSKYPRASLHIVVYLPTYMNTFLFWVSALLFVPKDIFCWGIYMLHSKKLC